MWVRVLHINLISFKYTQLMKNKKNLGHLSPDQMYVTQEQGTEAPFTGDLLYNKGTGTYVCVCCDNVLFSSDQNLIQEQVGQVFLISQTQTQLQ